MPGPYNVEIRQFGILMQTYIGLSKREAKDKFYEHFDRTADGATVILGNKRFTLPELERHFGKRKPPPEIILSRGKKK